MTTFGPELAPGSRTGAAAMESVSLKGRSLWDDARRRLFRNKAAVAGLAILALLVALAVVGPFLLPYTYLYNLGFDKLLERRQRFAVALKP